MKRKHYALNKDKFLTHDEERSLLESLNVATYRDALIIKLALHTGARANEILGIRKNDVDTNNMEVFITASKGGNDRSIPLSEELFNALHCQALDSDTEKVFNISYPRLDQIWDKYKPNGKKFHSLRHTCALRLFEKHENIRLVQVVLGHRSIMNTMIYAEYFYNTQELRKYMIAK